MPQVIAYEDAIGTQSKERGAVRIRFLTSSQNTPRAPSAFLVKGDPDRVIDPHFHVSDEFLVIVDGNGTLGRHEVAPYSVFFARAHTAYGPIVADSKAGLTFLVLFSRFDPGAKYFPQSLELLRQARDRQPWHIARQVKFPRAQDAAAGGVNLQEVPGIKDDQGLFASALTMAPNTATAAPDPSRGDGQYVVVVKGSLWHDTKEHKAMTVVFVEPEDGPFELHAGAQGLEAIIMNFPQVKPRTPDKAAPSAAPGFKKWQCELCAFAYDEALGLPADGIPAGTRWEDVPENWTCPDCSSAKSDFQMVVVQ